MIFDHVSGDAATFSGGCASGPGNILTCSGGAIPAASTKTLHLLRRRRRRWSGRCSIGSRWIRPTRSSRRTRRTTPRRRADGRHRRRSDALSRTTRPPRVAARLRSDRHERHRNLRHHRWTTSVRRARATSAFATRCRPGTTSAAPRGTHGFTCSHAGRHRRLRRGVRCRARSRSSTRMPASTRRRSRSRSSRSHRRDDAQRGARRSAATRLPRSTRTTTSTSRTRRRQRRQRHRCLQRVQHRQGADQAAAGRGGRRAQRQGHVEIKVKNDGTDPATGVVVRDFLPAGVGLHRGHRHEHASCAAQAGDYIECVGGELGQDRVGHRGGDDHGDDVRAGHAGNYTNQAIVDPQNAIPEGNEFNNQVNVAADREERRRRRVQRPDDHERRPKPITVKPNEDPIDLHPDGRRTAGSRRR